MNSNSKIQNHNVPVIVITLKDGGIISAPGAKMSTDRDPFGLRLYGDGWGRRPNLADVSRLEVK